MNKSTYLDQLKTALEQRKVADIDEIIEEYSQHFSLKMADGYSAEEIAAKLESPTVIAQQFESDDGRTEKPNKGKKVVLVVGMGFADVLLAMVYAVLYAWVIVFGLFSIACFGAAMALVLGIRTDVVQIPYTPYLGGLVTGLSLLALSVLSAIGTIYLHLYLIQLTRAYGRWHKNILSSRALPPLPLHPVLSAKFKRRTRKVSMVAAIGFAILISLGLLILFAYADFQPFWHAWKWFQ